MTKSPPQKTPPGKKPRAARPPRAAALTNAGLTQAVQLSRDAGMPLHHQVFLVLKDQVQSGRYAAGAVLPREDDLTRIFTVSRTTVRAALAALEAEGLIVRRQGIGTFVRNIPLHTPVRAAMRDHRLRVDSVDRRTKVRLIELDYVPAPPAIRDWFGAGTDELFQRSVRLRVALKPVLHMTNYVPEAVGRLIDRDEIPGHQFHDLLQRAGVVVDSIEQIISAVLADPILAGRLEVEVGSPLLRMRQFSYDDRARPIRYMEVLASPNEFEFHMSLESDDVRR